LAKQHIAFSLKHFQEALRIQPHNKSIEYTVQMLAKNERLTIAPPDYVKSLFDSYADHYEMHLLKALDYQIPLLFEKLLKGFLHPPLDILDLGCGTGLCGVPFKASAKTLTGVDLSANMLAFAAKKEIYHTLITADIQTFLAAKQDAYDLILAGDVLVYLGDLADFFKQIQKALRSEGLFIFNTEITTERDYATNQSGRFSHGKKYIDDLAKKYGLQIVKYQEAVTRLQNNEKVLGHLYLLKK
jgi:predicted TPR repeat methyltransferase